jgi:AcrR family transcriptional regulator
MLSGPQPRQVAVGLLLGHPAVLDGPGEGRLRVPDADLPHHLVASAVLEPGAQPGGFLLGYLARGQELVDALRQVPGVRSARPGVTVVIHTSKVYRDSLSLSSHNVYIHCTAYPWSVPKLWSETIAAHRREVRDAILDTTAALVAEHGLRAVTMSQIAGQTGIGRATLYKYFSDVEAILMAWHERQVISHLDHLRAIGAESGEPGRRLQAVLTAYALMTHELARRHHGTDLASLVHHGEHLLQAEDQLTTLLQDLLAEAVRAGAVRSDVAPAELAAYGLNALAAARGMPSAAAVRRLVALVMSGLCPAQPQNFISPI